MKFLFTKKRLFVLCITSIFVIEMYQYIFLSEKYPGIIRDDITNDISCYDTPDDNFRVLADDKSKTKSKTIFFLETSCKGGLDSRQACSVESAAKANPQWTIRVFFTGPINETYQNGYSLSVLTSIANIEFERVNVRDFTKGTPLAPLFTNNYLKNSSYPVVHASDFLRFLVLNKYGGVYLDLDMIVMKSFNGLPRNFLTREFGANLAVGVLAFTKDGLGKLISDNLLRYASSYHKLDSWGGNGVGLLSRMFFDICGTNSKSWYICAGVHIYANETFIPVPYQSWRVYYEDHEIKPSDAYTHHVWNALGRKTKIPKNSLYSRLAQRYCPIIYELYGDHFGD